MITTDFKYWATCARLADQRDPFTEGAPNGIAGLIDRVQVLETALMAVLVANLSHQFGQIKAKEYVKRIASVTDTPEVVIALGLGEPE